MVTNEYKHLALRMDRIVAAFATHVQIVRSGRVSKHILDHIMVECNGTVTPVTKVAQVTTPYADEILVTPWESSLAVPIERAIRGSGWDLNPSHDGKAIHFPIPLMTEYRRRELVDQLPAVLEEHRVLIRNICREGHDGVKISARGSMTSGHGEKQKSSEIHRLTERENLRLDELFHANNKPTRVENAKPRDLSGPIFILLFLVLIVGGPMFLIWAVTPNSIRYPLFYGSMYRVGTGHVHVQKKRTDCEWGHAPIGEKDCHYEKRVWTTDDSSEHVADVYVGWEKLQD